MKHLLLLLALLPVTLSAQESLRGRWACRGDGCASAIAAAVVIEGPTLSQTLQTTEDTLLLSGRARNDVTRIEWSNDRGGSGVASGTAAWSVEATGGGEPETVFEDTFTVDSATDLVDHTPSPVGVGWTEVQDTSGVNFAKINTANDFVQPGVVESTHKLIYIATPASVVSGTHYTVSWKLASNYSASSGTDSAVIFGWVDTDNYCALSIRSSTQNPDLILMKRVAGTNTDLSVGVNVAPVANQTYSLEVDGTALTVQQNGVTVLSATDSAGACDGSTDAGLGWGDIRISGRTINTVATFDDFKIVDEEVEAAGIVLQSGVNVITATAYCGDPVCGTDTLTVTKDVTDTVDPLITITGPTSGADYPTSTAALPPIEGITSDNIGVVDVTCECATCTPTSRVATITGETWITGTFTLAVGPNDIICTATDAATNETPDSFTATYTANDVTPPVTTITSPTSGATWTATENPLPVGGTSTDAVGVTLVTCQNSVGGGTVTATGGTGTNGTWSCDVPVFNGEQTITVTSRDEAGNTHPDSFVVTYVPALTITSNTALPGASQNVAYSVTLTVNGGTAPFTWDNDGAGTTLNDGDAQCAGLTISSAGVVSGTPTQTGTCSFTSHVTDDVAAEDDQAHTILISAVGTGQHAFFEANRLRPEWWNGYSLRPPGTGHPLITDPFYDKQLNRQGDGGFHHYNCDPLIYSGNTYQPLSDTDPHKQDAMKLSIPPFTEPGFCGGHALTVAMSASTQGANDIITLTDVTSTYSNRQLQIEDEILRMRICTVADGGDGTQYRIEATNQVCVIRGQYGTTAAAHAIGIKPKLSSNQPSYIKIPVAPPGSTTEDGYTYLITWDAYWTDSWVNVYTWDGGSKSFSITGGNNADSKFIEPKVRTDGKGRTGVNGALETPPGYIYGTHVGAVAMRSYNSLNTAGLAWPETNGNFMGPDELAHTDVYPQAGNIIIKPNTWTRWWMRIRQNLNDYDQVSIWVADENNEAVLIFDETEMSVSMTLDPTKQRMNYFQFAWGNSQSQFLRGGVFDLVVYLRNWSVLRWTHAAEPADLAAEGLMIKPIGSGGS